MKGVSMNRNLLALALFFFATPGFSMTATVVSGAQPAAAPTAPATAGAANAAGASSATKASSAPAAGKTAMPDATSLTRPSTVLSAPGIPMKASAPPVRAAGARSAPGPILPSTAPQSVAPAPWVASSDNSTGMRRGTLQAISPGAGTFQVFGQKLSFNAQKVKVFNRDGNAGSVFSLKAGTDIRFTLDPSDTLHRRVAVIYVN
jgi:hypothetical protein